MSRIDKFEDLEVWKRARAICSYVEKLFQTTGIGDNYRLRNQMEGSSGSIMDNIAEGFDRDGNKEFHNFLFTQRVLLLNLNHKHIEHLIKN